MKYLKAILKNPWIVLLLIVFLANTYYMFVDANIINSFTSGLALCTLFYAFLGKLRNQLDRENIILLESMSNASEVSYTNEEGKRINRKDDEYMEGFRDASRQALRNIKQ